MHFGPSSSLTSKVITGKAPLYCIRISRRGGGLWPDLTFTHTSCSDWPTMQRWESKQAFNFFLWFSFSFVTQLFLSLFTRTTKCNTMNAIQERRDCAPLPTHYPDIFLLIMLIMEITILHNPLFIPPSSAAILTSYEHLPRRSNHMPYELVLF